MKKKIMILGIILILMATIVTALQYGDIIEKSDIANWDLKTVNLQREHIKYEVKGRDIIQISSIAGLKNVNETHAMFTQKQITANGVKLKTYQDCLQNDKYSITQCNAWAIMTLDLNMDEKEDIYREQLVKIWQPEDVEQITLE